MSANQSVAPLVAQPSLSAFNRVLALPWLDRSIALIACVPLFYLAYYRFQHLHLGIPLVTATGGSLLLIATMIIRRPPVRVTPNPFYWLIAFVATYWPLLVLSLIQQGHPIAPLWFSNSLSIVGMSITIWARISLGRNIGFVPAQRQLVTTGAYAFVRHPVYTGILFLMPAVVFRAYTPLNLSLFALQILWFIPVKTLIEESFLRSDPEYAAYMNLVRYRWIPFLL